MKEGQKVSLALDKANADIGTIIDREGITKVRVLWWDGEETIEQQQDLKEVVISPSVL